MKKIIMILTAMLTMAQMNAAANEAALNNEATNAQAATAVQADDENDNESTYQHPFKDKNESSKHWSITTNGFYFGMGVKHSLEAINNSFEIGLLNFAAVNYNSLHGQNLSLGVGIHHRSFSMKRPFMLTRGMDDQIVTLGNYPVESAKNCKSNLNEWTIQFPLMFSQKIVKKLDITVAGILNWNVFARADNHYEINKVDHEIKFKDLKQNKIGFDIMGALTWNELGIYCRYSPGKFFKDGFGPEIKNTWTMGFAIAM